uniref:VPS9 domain-containing protein n=1 Tax=Esox lucius TaxID=8010 RepID=A0A6Q2WUA5_ESOLU
KIRKAHGCNKQILVETLNINLKDGSGLINRGDPGSQRNFSVLDRILHTHPVWLQLSINAECALYILLREPVGTFLVRKCSSSQRKVLCVRVAAERAPSSIKECFICEEDSGEYLALEKALFGCVLKPLKALLGQVLLSLHKQDGTTQRLACSLLACQPGALERLGVRVGVPDARGLERVKQKLALMQRTHSPIDKVLLLLQVCKEVQKDAGALRDGGDSEDFLLALSYVVVMCNTPQILLEVEYMMELLEPSWLTGEGGYYLTSVYASLCLIQSLEVEGSSPPPRGLTRETQDRLRAWGRRRSLEAKSNRERQQNQNQWNCTKRFQTHSPETPCSHTFYSPEPDHHQ